MPLTVVQSKIGPRQPKELFQQGIVGMPRLLGVLYGANMNVTTDQAIALTLVPEIAAGTAQYYVDAVVATNASISLTTAVGGVYTTVSKGGTAIVPAQQTYTALTAATKTLTLPQLFYTASLTPAQVAANTTAEQTFTVNGLAATTWAVTVNKPTAQAGLGIVGARVTAANTIGITFSNNTAAPITPTGGETYIVMATPPPATDVFTAGTLYLSLTTAQGAAATADLYVWGRVLP